MKGAALHVVNINSDELPEDAQRDFATLKRELSMVLANSLSSEEAVGVARKVLSLYKDLSAAPHWSGLPTIRRKRGNPQFSIWTCAISDSLGSLAQQQATPPDMA